MPKLWTAVLNLFQSIGDHSGCHQLKKRSFKIKCYVFPVCARCTGVFVGQCLAILLFIFNIVCNLYLSIFLLFLMGSDWFIQEMNIKKSNNIRRFITGICGGYGLFNIYYIIAVKIISWFF